MKYNCIFGKKKIFFVYQIYAFFKDDNSHIFQKYHFPFRSIFYHLLIFVGSTNFSFIFSNSLSCHTHKMHSFWLSYFKKRQKTCHHFYHRYAVEWSISETQKITEHDLFFGTIDNMFNDYCQNRRFLSIEKLQFLTCVQVFFLFFIWSPKVVNLASWHTLAEERGSSSLRRTQPRPVNPAWSEISK